MGVLLLAAGLGLIALPGWCAGFGRRLPAREWARLCQGAIATGAVVVGGALALYAAPTALRLVGSPALARMCQHALRFLVPGAAWAGWLAAAAALTIAVSSGVGALRARRGAAGARIEPWLGEHRRCDGYDLVILPTDRPIALSVTGTPHQVVISRGLVQTLTSAQLDLVVRHEAAHLELRHQRSLHIAAAIERGFTFFLPARPSIRALRTALERCADEAAVATVPEGRSVLRSALFDIVAVAVGVELAAFAAAGTVAERLDALAGSDPQPCWGSRALMYAPALLVAAMIAGAAALSAGPASMVVSMALHCA